MMSFVELDVDLSLPTICPRTIDWIDRVASLEYLAEDGVVLIRGKDLPDPEDPSDPGFLATITLADVGRAHAVWLTGAKKELQIPELHWPGIRDFKSKIINNYFKHWFFKVLDDPQIYRAEIIRVEGWL